MLYSCRLLRKGNCTIKVLMIDF